ncbi:MAG TPA: hypothetical protein VGE22_09670 [Solimonas sp.]|jgi:hypothetical protein
MSAPMLENAAMQWRENRRLRMAVLVAMVALALHLLDGLDRHRESAMRQHAADIGLRQRLERVAGQPEWVERAKQAEAELDGMRREMRVTANAGQAQAEIEAWLTEFAAAQKLSGPAVKVQDVLEVPGHPELVQVLARLDGTLPAFAQHSLVQALERGLPWMQVERLDIGEQSEPKISLVMRAYYRRAGQGVVAGTVVSEAAP